MEVIPNEGGMKGDTPQGYDKCQIFTLRRRWSVVPSLTGYVFMACSFHWTRKRDHFELVGLVYRLVLLVIYYSDVPLERSNGRSHTERREATSCPLENYESLQLRSAVCYRRKVPLAATHLFALDLGTSRDCQPDDNPELLHHLE